MTEQRNRDMQAWVRRAGALVVAGVAAYASYQHQRTFALDGGADATSAGLWPLSVDGLLLLATAGLLTPRGDTERRARLAAWLAFGLGIGVSLAANIASAPTLDWHSVLVAGWPPVALLLAVELLAHRSRPQARTETELEPSERPIETSASTGRRSRKAEALMWEHFQREQSEGRTPSGAELDRIAGTNNFGRAVLRRWRQAGQIPAAATEADTTRLNIDGDVGRPSQVRRQSRTRADDPSLTAAQS